MVYGWIHWAMEAMAIGPWLSTVDHSLFLASLNARLIANHHRWTTAISPCHRRASSSLAITGNYPNHHWSPFLDGFSYFFYFGTKPALSPSPPSPPPLPMSTAAHLLPSKPHSSPLHFKTKPPNSRLPQFLSSFLTPTLQAARLAPLAVCRPTPPGSWPSSMPHYHRHYLPPSSLPPSFALPVDHCAAVHKRCHMLLLPTDCRPCCPPKMPPPARAAGATTEMSHADHCTKTPSERHHAHLFVLSCATL